MYLGLSSIRQGNTAQCVQDCFQIIYPDCKTVLDTTWGKGRFWKWDHDLDVTGLDIAPQADDVVQGDYRNIPADLGAFDVMCWDPMFLFTAGISRVMSTKRFFSWSPDATAQMIARPESPEDLMEHAKAIFQQAIERARIGLIVKGQDLVVQNSDWWLHNLMNLAEEMGLGQPYDILIQQSPAARLKDKRWRHQYHFRRVHAFYVCWRWDGGRNLRKLNRERDRAERAERAEADRLVEIPEVALPEVQGVDQERAD